MVTKSDNTLYADLKESLTEAQAYANGENTGARTTVIDIEPSELLEQLTHFGRPIVLDEVAAGNEEQQ